MLQLAFDIIHAPFDNTSFPLPTNVTLRSLHKRKTCSSSSPVPAPCHESGRGGTIPPGPKAALYPRDNLYPQSVPEQWLPMCRRHSHNDRGRMSVRHTSPVSRTGHKIRNSSCRASTVRDDLNRPHSPRGVMWVCRTTDCTFQPYRFAGYRSYRFFSLNNLSKDSDWRVQRQRKNLFFKFVYTEELPYLHATKIPKGERRGKCRALIFTGRSLIQPCRGANPKPITRTKIGVQDSKIRLQSGSIIHSIFVSRKKRYLKVYH